jgi:monoamine oxidase
MPFSSKISVLMLGANVTGLPAALELARAGLRVEILEAKPPHRWTRCQLTLSGDYTQNASRRVCLTVATSSDSTVCKVKSWLSHLNTSDESTTATNINSDQKSVVFGTRETASTGRMQTITCAPWFHENFGTRRGLAMPSGGSANKLGGSGSR